MNKQTLTKRQSTILRVVHSRENCSIADLAEQLNVCEETIRRDIRPMSKSGVLQKSRGQVSLPSEKVEPPFQRRISKNILEKQRIGEAAAELISPNSSVIIDPGSTSYYTARALREKPQLNVITNSAEIARVFALSPNIQLYLAGGEFRHDDAATFGPTTLDFIRAFSADCLIMSVGGIDAKRGIMDFDLKHVEFSRSAMQLVREVIVVADHSKFDARGLAAVCPLSQIDIFVTDAAPEEPFRSMLSEAGVRLVVAE